jgi:hypothetical protein
MSLKKPAAKEIKTLIAKMRDICDRLDDCPVKRARKPSQLDCIACILGDVQVMAEELKALREFKVQATQYGTNITKLEVTLEPELMPLLKSEIKEDSHDR